MKTKFRPKARRPDAHGNQRGERRYVDGYDDTGAFHEVLQPVPGDSIVGYITRGRGVSVHRSDCPNVTTDDFESGRMIEVIWSTSDKSSYNVEIQVIADDRSGLIAEVSNKLFNMGFSITSVNARMGKNRTANMVFGFEISDISQLDAIVKGLRSIEGVRDVFRIYR